MQRSIPWRRRLLAALVALTLALLGSATLTSSSRAEARAAAPAAVAAVAPAHPTSSDRRQPKPTIVLVHGAFADSSGWTSVTEPLLRRGYPVVAFANPLRGVTPDAAYLRLFLATISGPIVLVGHSYGGAVISNAATGNPNVKSLVYVAAYALDEGESVAAANELGGGHTEVTDHLVYRPFPGATDGDADAYIDPLHYHRLFAQDLPRKLTGILATQQRPGALAALVTPSGAPAWKTIPSWYLVAKQDRIIPPEAERAMARRAGATTVSINSSHVAMMSHPDVVLKLILSAAR